MSITSFHKSIFVSLCIISYPLLCMDNVEKFTMPVKLQQILDKAYQIDRSFKACVDAEEICKCPLNFPCFVKPFNINRLENYTYLENILKQHILDEVILPQKFLWQNKSTLRTHIVAEKLKPIRTKGKCSFENITVKQFLQILILGQNGVWDFAGGNNKFKCTNIFLTNSMNSAFWEERDQAKAASTESKLAIIDTKRIIVNTPSKYVPANLFNMFGASYNKCYRNDVFYSEFHTLSKNPSTSSIKEFWGKWESCFKV